MAMGSLEELDASFRSVPRAVIGAVAANRFMPPRHTGDIDFAISERDETEAVAVLQEAGWRRHRPLALRPPLTGFAWQTADGSWVDVITVPGGWGQELVDSAMANRARGLPIAALPQLVILKMIAGRSIDAGDISRMLGHQDAITLEAVRAVARRVLGAEELSDLDQLIELGQLEYRPRPEGLGPA
jgi:hypothetical protein